MSIDRSRPAPTFHFKTDEPRATFGFGRLLSDSEVIDWLEAHGVEPRAFFMRPPGGFNGAHRLYEDEEKSLEEVLEDARAETIQAFEHSLDGNLVRLQRFAERYTEEEVAASGDLQEEARSLLSLRSAFEEALNGAEQGDPFIYSVEVAGEDPVLGQLQTGQRTAKPFAEQAPSLDPFVQDMTVEEVYQEIQELGDSAPATSLTGPDLQPGE